MIESKNYTEKFHKSHEEGSYKSAMQVLPLINSIFKPASVVDVGCGSGDWLKVWQEQIGVSEIKGFEGPYVAPSTLNISPQYVTFQDLKQPLLLDKKFDLAMSVEVAEHLPATHARQFIKSLTDASDVILFSASIQGQEGTYHINEQQPEYWAKIFASFQYEPIDYLRPIIWNNEAIEWWYRQNILLFIKSDRIKDFPELQKAYQETRPDYLFRVHPGLYFYQQDRLTKTSTILGYIRWRLYLIKKSFREKFEK